MELQINLDESKQEYKKLKANNKFMLQYYTLKTFVRDFFPLANETYLEKANKLTKYHIDEVSIKNLLNLGSTGQIER